MADKSRKRKAKAGRAKASVLGNLPATRPQRLGRPRADAPPAAVEEPPEPPRRRKRESPPRAAAGPARVEATPASRRRTADGAPAKARAPRTAPAGKARAAKPVAATPAAAKRRAAKPRAAAAAKARPAKDAAQERPAARRAAKDAARQRPSAPRPAAVRPGVRSLEHQQRVGDPPPVRSVQPPRGTELVTTTIQAVGELAQIGFTVGGRALKRAVDRLPKP